VNGVLPEAFKDTLLKLVDVLSFKMKTNIFLLCLLYFQMFNI
jgi:hypothetical protein